MIVQTFFISILAWSAIRCEPPVNSYLPPSNSGNGRPSTQYGPPSSGGAAGNSQQGSGAQFSSSNTPQSSYLPPGRSGQSSVDTQYGPPSSGGFSSGSSSQDQQLRQGSGQGKPDSQYGTPNQNGRFSAGLNGGHSQPDARSNSHPTSNSQGRQSFGNGGSSNGRNFGPDNQSFDQKPGSSYNPSAAGYRSSGSDSNSNGGFGGHPGGARLTDASQGSFSGTPSSSYGTPGFGGNGAGHGNGGGSGSGFGGGNGGLGGDDSNEPAKYQFSYDVDDAQTGTKFGHSEQRDGDLATGEYNVVLPDGRKQVVEYEAGLEGYKPQIRYEGTGNGGSRQGSGSGGFGESQRLSQGYTENGPNEGGFQSNNVDNFGGSGEQTFGQLRGSNAQAGNGYPSGRQNGQNQGYSNGGSEQNGNQGVTSGNNSAGRLNGGSQGYPSGGPRSNGRGSANDPQSEFSNASRRGNSRNAGGTSRNEGYPSGGPNGIRGSGY